MGRCHFCYMYLKLYLETLGQIELETFKLLKVAKSYLALVPSCVLASHFQ